LFFFHGVLLLNADDDDDWMCIQNERGSPATVDVGVSIREGSRVALSFAWIVNRDAIKKTQIRGVARLPRRGNQEKRGDAEMREERGEYSLQLDILALCRKQKSIINISICAICSSMSAITTTMPKFIDLNSLYFIFIAKSFHSFISFANEAKGDDRIQTALVFSNSSNYPFYFSYIDAGLKLSLSKYSQCLRSHVSEIASKRLSNKYEISGS